MFKSMFLLWLAMRCASVVLLCGVMRFIPKHSLLRPFATFPLLPAYFLDARAFSCHESLFALLDFVQQQPPRDEPIQSLLPRRLAFHLHPRWAMDQHHARRCLINVLAAMSSRPHKTFLNFPLIDAQLRHSLRQLRFLFDRDRK